MYTGLGWWQAAVAAVPTVVKAFNSISSPSDQCWSGYNNRPEDPCPGTPNYDAVMRAVEAAPDSEIRVLISYLLGGNDGRGPKSRRALLKASCLTHWVKAVMGGKDCVATRYPEAPEWFEGFVQKYGAPPEGVRDYPGSSIVAVAATPAGKTALAAAAALTAIFVLPALFGDK